MAEEKEKNKAHTKTAPVYAVKNLIPYFLQLLNREQWNISIKKGYPIWFNDQKNNYFATYIKR